MTPPDPDPGAPPPRWQPLDATQRRVLGVLVEKSKTTPAGYPMTVHAIVAGCNQRNNRDPLTALDDIDVSNTLVELQRLAVVEEIDWLGRAPKYKHKAYEWLGVSKAELAVMAELLLRGAQTLGELRARAARMEPIADLAALAPIVDALVARGLMLALTPPGRGQVVSHRLYPAPELAEVRARLHGDASRAEPGAAEAPRAPTAARHADRSDEIAELREEIARLHRRIADLEARLGPG